MAVATRHKVIPRRRCIVAVNPMLSAGSISCLLHSHVRRMALQRWYWTLRALLMVLSPQSRHIEFFISHTAYTDSRAQLSAIVLCLKFWNYCNSLSFDVRWFWCVRCFCFPEMPNGVAGPFLFLPANAFSAATSNIISV